MAKNDHLKEENVKERSFEGGRSQRSIVLWPTFLEEEQCIGRQRWAPGACHPRSPTTADGGSLFASAQAARTSASRRGHQPFIILNPKQMLSARGNEPFVILSPKRMLTDCVN